MKMRYIGEHGSMGLVRGKEYKVSINTRYNYIVVTWSDFRGKHACPYATIKAMLQNWEEIE